MGMEFNVRRRGTSQNLDGSVLFMGYAKSWNCAAKN